MSSYAKRLLANPQDENATAASTISLLNLQKHPEGGYFVETDRDNLEIPNPFLHDGSLAQATSQNQSATRNASTTICYLISRASPIGHFHRNKGRTIHTLHRGRGTYVIIHADEVAHKSHSKARVETFTVGPNLAKGEKLQWIVEGGKFKASFLLPDHDEEESMEGCLISETVVPGFDFADHDFLTADGFRELLEPEDRDSWGWLLRKEE